MSKQYKKENDILAESILQNNFFNVWSGGIDNANFSKIEIELTTTCNLGCKYCYIHRYGDSLYPKSIRDRQTILKNLKILLNWLTENNLTPHLDFFSGDPLSQEIGFEALEIIMDHYRGLPKKARPGGISIPTNYTFLLDKDLKQRVEFLLRGFEELGIYVGLSASIDGKYLEHDNRPLLLVKGRKEVMEESSLPAMTASERKEVRDDEYYDEVFSFTNKAGGGLHPMIYSKGIEKWKDNFLWFQDMMKKHEIPWYKLYLLEVRNEEWSEEQMAELHNFSRFLVNWSFDRCDRNPEDFLYFLFKKSGFNMLASPFNIIGRGLGCSFQSMVYVRMGDLSLIPCHRTSYDGFEYAKFKVMNDKIIGIESKNVEFLTTGLAFNAIAQPMCESCLIKHSCSHGCLGSQYEATGDMFSPILTVCKMEHAKIIGIVKGLIDCGIFNRILSLMPIEKRYGLEKLASYYN